MQGAVQSCITCRVQYAVCQSMRKSFRDASEMHWKSTEFDMQGRTLTQTHLSTTVQDMLNNGVLHLARQTRRVQIIKMQKVEKAGSRFEPPGANAIQPSQRFG